MFLASIHRHHMMAVAITAFGMMLTVKWAIQVMTTAISKRATASLSTMSAMSSGLAS